MSRRGGQLCPVSKLPSEYLQRDLRALLRSTQVLWRPNTGVSTHRHLGIHARPGRLTMLYGDCGEWPPLASRASDCDIAAGRFLMQFGVHALVRTGVVDAEHACARPCGSPKRSGTTSSSCRYLIPSAPMRPRPGGCCRVRPADDPRRWALARGLTSPGATSLIRRRLPTHRPTVSLPDGSLPDLMRTM